MNALLLFQTFIYLFAAVFWCIFWLELIAPPNGFVKHYVLFDRYVNFDDSNGETT